MFHFSIKLTVIAVFFCALLASGPVFAYLDPGTGSIILQGVIAALAAIGVTARLYWHRLLELFGRKKLGNQESTPPGEQDKSRVGADDYE